jgi:short-subunit dehydrogenase involved in D-alanine esterification of teichoic acids
MTHHAASQDDLSIGALFNFKDHIVLITGGATGLGEMAAQGFVQNGSRVFIASRKESELKKVCSTLRRSAPMAQ